ncbi:hypothetical protein ARMSODRAFT_963031 [Armillaria solidipes]|uniref:Uncharacterized protein n=1 Tax=Armillaria solidipes TaxID=1076256 RepID=A0A2H3BFS3_9AGAR|nr:hypothetical protein ARMSODRAFT_963031 [Armillaria solidipes]
MPTWSKGGDTLSISLPLRWMTTCHRLKSNVGFDIYTLLTSVFLAVSGWHYEINGSAY